MNDKEKTAAPLPGFKPGAGTLMGNPDPVTSLAALPLKERLRKLWRREGAAADLTAVHRVLLLKEASEHRIKKGGR